MLKQFSIALGKIFQHSSQCHSPGTSDYGGEAIDSFLFQSGSN